MKNTVTKKHGNGPVSSFSGSCGIREPNPLHLNTRIQVRNNHAKPLLRRI